MTIKIWDWLRQWFWRQAANSPFGFVRPSAANWLSKSYRTNS